MDALKFWIATLRKKTMIKINLKITYMAFFICFSIILTGCGLDILEPASPIEDTEVEYVIVENGEISLPLTGFNDLNPLLVDNIDYFYFSKLTFEGLFDYDNTLMPIPKLATTYILSDDGKRVELYLREGVVWHNGESFKADDVIHTFNALIAAKSEGYLYKLLENTVRGQVDMNFMKLRKLSDRSIEVVFKEPLSNWKDLLTFPIVPVSTGKSVLTRDGYEPVGTGPFKFREYVKYKEVLLDSFADYWGGKPQISRVSGKIYEDEELILTAFETGKLSMARSIGFDWDKYEHISRIRFLEYVSDEIELLTFNHNVEPFNLKESKYLKRALMLGIDRQDIINKVLLQHGTQSDTPIHPQSYISDPSTAKLGFSIDRMRQELAASGRYEISIETERVMDIIDQKELVLNLLVNPNNKTRKIIAERIREDLESSGIGINIVYPEPLKDESMDQAFLRMLLNGNFQIALVGFSVSTVPELLPLLNAVGWIGNQENQPGGFDSYIYSTYASWDESTKFDDFSRLQRTFTDEIPVGSLFFLNRSLMVDNQVYGPLEPNFYNLYNGLEKCFLIFSTD